MGDIISFRHGRCDHRRSNFSLRQNASLYLRFRVGRHEMAADTNQTSNISTLTSHPDEYFVHLPDKTICRLELEASVTLFCGVASLCVCALPLAFVFLTLIICKIGYEMLECDVVTVWLFIPYAREMLLFHSVISREKSWILQSVASNSSVLFPSGTKWQSDWITNILKSIEQYQLFYMEKKIVPVFNLPFNATWIFTEELSKLTFNWLISTDCQRLLTPLTNYLRH